ncbi:hypothetical protein DID99_28365 [Burkholderia sp. Bp8986]|nr:hypothetical protein DID99_28365 [Burkholderia sp. Bp8986]
MFGGLYYEVRLYGAVNGNNTLTIQSGQRTIFVAKSDKFSMRFVWRRSAVGANGWIMTRYEALP